MNKKVERIIVIICCLIMIFYSGRKFIILRMIEDASIEQTTEQYGLVPEYGNVVDEVNLREVINASKDFKSTLASGHLYIPSVGIDLNIYEGTNKAHLMQGAAEQVKRTVVRNGGIGNYILVSHRMFKPGLLFTELYRVEPGELIYTTDNKYVYTYIVDSNETVDITQTQWLDQVADQYLITLYCCRGKAGGNKRTVVRGHLISADELNENSISK